MKYYYKLYTSTPFAGTDNTVLIRSDNPNYEVDEEIIKQNFLDDYGYLEFGWDGEPTEEQEEEFKESCEVCLTAISEETFNAMAEDGFDVEED